MLEPIDEARLVSNVSGDADILARLVRAFEASYRQDLECLAAAISTGDEAELRRGAHKLCGSLGDLAAAPASRAAQELGERARAGDTAGLRASYRRLDSEVERARRALMKIAERRGVETPAD